MFSSKQVFIATQGVRSLCWQGDTIVDWVEGGIQYALDGSKKETYRSYAYDFDSAAVSPSGRYAAIYTKLGTKGLLLDAGKDLREINRSYYQANVYEYPVLLFQLLDGREVIAHCPEDYNKLEIEEIETGKRLTSRPPQQATDFFQSRLSTNPSGTKLMSAGWVWHPFDSTIVYDIQNVLANPASLDRGEPLYSFVAGDFLTEDNSSIFASDSRLVIACADYKGHDNVSHQSLYEPGHIAIYDLGIQDFVSVVDAEDIAGTMMPIGTDHILGFYDHPKVIDLKTGQVVCRWPEIKSGKQISSIIWHQELPPPMALDPANRRFAVAGEDGITIVFL
jgi:hypothetical protein